MSTVGDLEFELRRLNAVGGKAMAQDAESYEDAKRRRDGLEAEVKRTNAVLDAFPKGAMNMTPDAVKNSPEFRAAKQAFNTAFAQLRDFNEKFVRTYQAEIRADRRR